ncbi:hypothetical protein IWQ57_004683 [Coemansia nantahalensis]|uniref:Uncharacterized protein n=1 Tax=Coemansia nantahalensis TaxID=2789366 RepID=A0ACC1JR51_9FUNG|nr:hypothetical protein IWQ57_004683 [Coemansia nantahalensis]
MAPITVGVDVGGSLVKIVVLAAPAEPGPGEHPLETYLRRAASAEGAPALPDTWQRATVATAAGALDALLLPVADMARLMEGVEQLGPAAGGPLCVAATGGGALKHRAELERRLGVELVAVPELDAVVHGLLADPGGAAAGERALVCNVGTGLSLASVDAQGAVQRVSGSGIGGATFWGLVRRLTRFAAFDDAVVAARDRGRLGAADTLVGDIYGPDSAAAIGLPPDLVAGFLGKLDAPDLPDADVVAALLRMLASNIAQLAVFQARLLAVDAVYVTGGFVPPGAAGDVVRAAIAEATAFWSAGKIAARFPRCPALLGAIGAIVCLSGASSDQI